MTVSMDSGILEQLDTAQAKALHDVEAKLSACGVARIVNLPRLVVVGDQSAGKSSVLEAISHVRFPVEGGLCTRFATELILTQSPGTHVDVSVKFAEAGKPSRSFQRSGFSQDELPEIIREAKEYMGLSAAGKEFSKDVLRLEIAGPEMCHLTLIDLPGFFNSNTATQSLFGKAVVNEIVDKYMAQENSIILVVIDAATQLARQESLLRVAKMDPTRERTIGVITKPDRTAPGSFDEITYVQVAKNQENAHKLKHGWHVLRNRGDNEISLDERDDVERQFFTSGAWASVADKDVGIANFRKKLSEIRYAHLRKHLPGVVDDIDAKLKERQYELTRLGQSRLTEGEKRAFLLRIAMDFQRLTRDGVHGLYHDSFFGGLDDGRRKLRAIVRNLGRAFDYVMRTKGCKQTIIFGDDEDSDDDDDEYVEDLRREKSRQYLESFLEEDHPYDFPDPDIVTSAQLNVQLQRQASDNRGCEFPGLPNHDMIIKLFQSQSEPWRDIAEVHIGHVVEVVEAFVTELFEHIAGPSGTNGPTDALLSVYADQYFDRKKKVLQEKLNELLRPYEEGYALPIDRELLLTMRTRQTASAAASDDSEREEDYGQAAVADEFGTKKVVDMMLAYYEVSRRTFTDNVVNLAIESCLIRDLPNIFTPAEVGNMDKLQVEELASESADSRSRREQLEADVKVLQEGLAQCRKYRIRTTGNTGPAVSASTTGAAPAPSAASRKTKHPGREPKNSGIQDEEWGEDPSAAPPQTSKQSKSKKRSKSPDVVVRAASTNGGSSPVPVPADGLAERRAPSPSVQKPQPQQQQLQQQQQQQRNVSTPVPAPAPAPALGSVPWTASSTPAPAPAPGSGSLFASSGSSSALPPGTGSLFASARSFGQGHQPNQDTASQPKSVLAGGQPAKQASGLFSDPQGQGWKWDTTTRVSPLGNLDATAVFRGLFYTPDEETYRDDVETGHQVRYENMAFHQRHRHQSGEEHRLYFYRANGLT